MRSPHTATKSSPRSPQLEKAREQQQRPNAAKKKKIKKNPIDCSCFDFDKIRNNLTVGSLVLLLYFTHW